MLSPAEQNSAWRSYKRSGIAFYKKRLIFISNRQRQKEGTFCASELAGIEPSPAHSSRAGYA
jgi:hypothetical protein